MEVNKAEFYKIGVTLFKITRTEITEVCNEDYYVGISIVKMKHKNISQFYREPDKERVEIEEKEFLKTQKSVLNKIINRF